MTAGPTIDRNVVSPIIDSIHALGGDTEALIADSGLASSWWNQRTDEIPEACVWELFERSSRSLDMPDVGLRVGTAFEVRDLGRFGKQLANSLTTSTCLGQYIMTVNRYSSHSHFWLEPRNDGVWFCRRGIDLIDVGRTEVEQFTLELMVHLVQLACGREWRPARVRIQANDDRIYRHHPSYGHATLLCREASTAIWLSPADSIRVIRWDDDEMTRLVRNTVAIGGRNSRPTIDQIAGQLGFSVRTLQRELSNHGLDWSRMLDQVYLRRAVELIATDTPLVEVAHELGYTDHANFGRAFRRWTGMAPRRYRVIANG